MKLFKSAVYQIKNISLFHSYIILAFRISFFSNLAASKTNPGHTCSSLKILPGSQTDNVYAVIDIETTGGQYNKKGITEIAIYKFDGTEIVDQFISLVNPEIRSEERRVGKECRYRGARKHR